MKAAFIRLTGFLTTVLSDILILYHSLLCKISDNQRQPCTHCYIERHPVREKQQSHNNKATRCVICRIDWILLTVKKNSLNTKRVRGILMLQSLSFLVISVMFYCSLSFCKIVPQTLYQRLYQSHVTFTPDPLSGNTTLGSQYRPRSTILLRLPPVITCKERTCREAIKRDMCLNISDLGGRRFQRLPGVKCLNVCQTTSVLKIKMISI